MMILVLMRKPGICRCRRFFQTIVEHCKFIYCTVTFILSDHCKYIKTKQQKNIGIEVSHFILPQRSRNATHCLNENSEKDETLVDFFVALFQIT